MAIKRVIVQTIILHPLDSRSALAIMPQIHAFGSETCAHLSFSVLSPFFLTIYFRRLFFSSFFSLSWG